MCECTDEVRVISMLADTELWLDDMQTGGKGARIESIELLMQGRVKGRSCAHSSTDSDRLEVENLLEIIDKRRKDARITIQHAPCYLVASIQ